MQFDTLDAPGAYDCAKCGDTPICMGSVSAGKPYYFLRCESCGMVGPTGPEVAWAISLWNGMGVYDGEKAEFNKHTQAYRKDKPPVNVKLAALEEKIKAWKERQAKREAKED